MWKCQDGLRIDLHAIFGMMLLVALIRMIFIVVKGFGLQIGSDFYLLLDRSMRHRLDDLAANLANNVALTGTWMADNGTENSPIPLVGTWTFTHAVAIETLDIVKGCYRPRSFPWYLQPFPFWTTFIIVPAFSTLSSLSNLQPLKSKQLPVMVVISCASYASNKIANHYIFNRSDIVSAIGAFTVGVLGNVYSRKMGGTAFTSMVTGVLFLVPVSILIVISLAYGSTSRRTCSRVSHRREALLPMETVLISVEL